MIKKIITNIFIITTLTSCMNYKGAGGFGVSEDITTSKSKNLYRFKYCPNKIKFKLLDSSYIQIDTAWTEIMWSYDEQCNPSPAEAFGYNFVVPIVKQAFDKFVFTLSLADTSNESFTNGIEENRCVLNPSKLLDTIGIILEQKNPNENGWKEKIVTDTIIFIKKSE